MKIMHNNAYALMRVKKSSPTPYFLISKVNKQKELEKIYWTKDINRADKFETINQLINYISNNKVAIKHTETLKLICQRCRNGVCEWYIENDGICDWITID